MDMRSLALLLLLTLGGTEQSYGPYRRPALGGDQAVAAARDKVLLAWSEEDDSGAARIHTVLLSSAGQALSPMHVLPMLDDRRHARVPAIGTDGVSFLVVWEETHGTQRTVAMTVGANGLPLGVPHPIAGDVPILSNAYEAARVHWFNGSYVVLTGSRQAVRVSADAMQVESLGGVSPEAVSADGTFARTAFLMVNTTPGYPGQREPWPPTWVPMVFWYADSRSGSEAVSSTPSKPFVTPIGKEFLIAWATTGRVDFRITRSLRQAIDAPVDQFSRIRADCATRRCVVAFSTTAGDIEGVILDLAKPDAPPLRFTAAATDRFEREPAVTMLTDSRALVTWRSTGPDGERLCGRPIVLEGKQRAVR